MAKRTNGNRPAQSTRRGKRGATSAEIAAARSLIEVDGLSQREAAARTGISLRAISDHSRRAKEAGDPWVKGSRAAEAYEKATANAVESRAKQIEAALGRHARSAKALVDLVESQIAKFAAEAAPEDARPVDPNALAGLALSLTRAHDAERKALGLGNPVPHAESDGAEPIAAIEVYTIPRPQIPSIDG